MQFSAIWDQTILRRSTASFDLAHHKQKSWTGRIDKQLLNSHKRSRLWCGLVPRCHFSLFLLSRGTTQSSISSADIDWDHNKPIILNMDFSKYGDPALEWTSYVLAHPIIDQPWTKPSEEETLTEIHISGNNARAAHDEITSKAHRLEGKFSSQDVMIATRDGSSIPLRIYTPNDTPSP